MPKHPPEDFSGRLDEPLVEDLLDETRGPEEDGLIHRTNADLLADEPADDVEPRD
jgi:hypothetical protein